MKRLIFFKGVYDTLDLFVLELKREFEALRYETMIFDVTKMQESLRQLMRFLDQPVAAVITFNNLGFNMELHPGKNIWEELKIPCINILMDHPYCYHTALAASPGNAIVLCVDKNHMRYLQRFYPNIPVAGYLPHGGIEAGGGKKPISKRKTDVLYAGGLSKSFALNVMPDLSKYTQFPVKQICEEIYWKLIDMPQKTFEQTVEEVLAANGIYCEDTRLAGLIADLHFIELYAVSYYREKTLRTLAESGIQITLYGAGWEDCPWIKMPNVHYEGKIHAAEIPDKMQNAKIVLNTMTWFKDGTHDRVFNGMLQGLLQYRIPLLT